MRGREFKPTPKQRQLVEEAASYGLKQTDIAGFMAIDKLTLYKHFRQELDYGKFKLDKLAGDTIRKSMGHAADERVRLDAARFYAARRMNWKENVGLEHTGADGGAIEVRDVSAVDLIRSRIEEAAARLGGDMNVEMIADNCDAPELPARLGSEQECFHDGDNWRAQDKSLDMDTRDVPAITTDYKPG